MKPGRDIDSALRALGVAQPPVGMERRIHARLDKAPHRIHTQFGTHVSIAIAVIAAGLLISAITLSPADNPESSRSSAQNYTRTAGHLEPAESLEPAHNPVDEVEQQILTRPRDSFGAASAVHVPDTPVAVGPAAPGRRDRHTRSRQPAHRNAIGGAEASSPVRGDLPKQPLALSH